MPTVSNRTELLNALSKAKGGETIILENGNYGKITVTADYANTVTIRAANKLKATIKELDVSGASNVRFDGLDFYSEQNGNQNNPVVMIESGSRNIDVVNSEIRGLKDNKYVGHNGLQVKNSSNIDVINNKIHNVDNGMIFSGNNINVKGNYIDYYANDALKFWTISNVNVEDNTSYGHVFPPSGAHNDFMQFQGPTKDAVITGNVFLPSIIASSQGIFLKNEKSENVSIDNNIIYTGMFNAVYVSNGKNISVTNNTLLDVPGQVSKSTGIRVPSGTERSDNIFTSHTGGNSGSNFKVISGDRSDPYYVDNFYQNGSKGLGVTIENLRPVKGSVAETKGAAARIFELLGGGSAPPRDQSFDSVIDPAPAPSPTPAPAPSSGAFTVTLIDAGSDKVVERLSDGESATISTPAARRTIDVVHSEKPGSIYMELERGNGAAVTTKLENVGPYSLTGDKSGDYKLPDFDFRDGSYSLTLTAYGGANKSGKVIGTDTFNFTLKQADSTSAPASGTTFDSTTDTGSTNATGGTASIAINAGGPATNGFQADAYASGGSTYKTGSAIAKTSLDKIYQTERWDDNFRYSVPVENGDHAVTLKFAEIYFGAAGKRVFDVSAEGKTLIENLDIYAEVGKNTAYDVTKNVTVTDGRLDLVFSSDVNNAKISGIEIDALL